MRPGTNDTKREESLREACSIGNFDAIQSYLNVGVNVNSQNKMNGWTAIHWAIHRDNAKVVSLLLDWGAKLDVQNSMGKTPLDYVKSDEMRSLLKDAFANLNQSEANPGEKMSPDFVPNYLMFPELIPAVSKPSESDLNVGSAAVNAGTHGEVDASKSIQVLIFKDQKQNDNLVGSVKTSSLVKFTALLNQIHEEIDGVPENAKWFKIESDLAIPINMKQYEKSLEYLFPSSSILLFKDSP